MTVAQPHMAPWEALLTDKDNLSSLSNEQAEAKQRELTQILNRFGLTHAAATPHAPPFER
jgi:hypothetical protein